MRMITSLMFLTRSLAVAERVRTTLRVVENFNKFQRRIMVRP